MFSRIIAIGFFCYIIGSVTETVGKVSEASVFTGGDAFHVILVLAAIMAIGFFAGLETAKD